VLLIKGASMGIALVAVIVNELRTGMEVSLVESGVFVFLAAVMLLLSGKTLVSVREEVRG
jgi:exoribonuclease II